MSKAGIKWLWMALLLTGAPALAGDEDCTQSDRQTLKTAETEGYYCLDNKSSDPCATRSWKLGRKRFIAEVKSGTIRDDNSSDLNRLIEEVKEALLKKESLPEQCTNGNACERLACRVLKQATKVHRTTSAEAEPAAEGAKPIHRGLRPVE